MKKKKNIETAFREIKEDENERKRKKNEMQLEHFVILRVRAHAHCAHPRIYAFRGPAITVTVRECVFVYRIVANTLSC